MDRVVNVRPRRRPSSVAARTRRTPRAAAGAPAVLGDVRASSRSGAAATSSDSRKGRGRVSKRSPARAAVGGDDPGCGRKRRLPRGKSAWPRASRERRASVAPAKFSRTGAQMNVSRCRSMTSLARYSRPPRARWEPSPRWPRRAPITTLRDRSGSTAPSA
jgi:hypothetical protein